jgi:hypothetical protein
MGELVDRDVEHLRLLHIAFYVMSGLAAFMSLFALIYIAIGGVVVAGVISQIPNTPNSVAPIVGWIVFGIGICFLFAGFTLTFLTFLAGRSLQERRRRTFCLIMAGLCCLQIPWGTVVGVCAINVLNRPSVRMLFDAPGPPPL